MQPADTAIYPTATVRPSIKHGMYVPQRSLLLGAWHRHAVHIYMPCVLRGGTELQACARANWSAVAEHTRHSRCHVTGRQSRRHPAQVLLGVASGGMEARALWRTNWAAVPATLPVLSLAFVYQNVVPVIASNLEVWLLRHCLLHRMSKLVL